MEVGPVGVAIAAAVKKIRFGSMTIAGTSIVHSKGTDSGNRCDFRINLHSLRNMFTAFFVYFVLYFVLSGIPTGF